MSGAVNVFVIFRAFKFLFQLDFVATFLSLTITLKLVIVTVVTSL